MMLTLIDGERRHAIGAQFLDGGVQVDPADVEGALGWKLAPEGLCRGSVCIPVRDRASLVREGGLDLAALASLIGRPLALDAEERAAALGESAGDRATALHTLEAPDFTLPDLSGRMHTLSDHRGKKALLIAYASW
ncbi:MAG TPA: hypothetical protein VKH41_05025 [Myxococcota bacterium]|nr:hypothetical protein [Myxococcota bacterium]